MEGTVLATFLIVFREALEAGLILGIIFTVLVKLKQKRYFPLVILSSVAGVLASVIAGILIMSLISSTQGIVEKWIEGGVSLAASCVLTYMVFWMDRQSKRIKPEIEFQVEKAATKGELITIVLLPFLAIFREGAETVLFLNAVAAQSSSSVSFWGAFWGLLLATAVTVAIFAGGKRIPLKPLFQTSGFFLLLVAAGLLAYGIHEFQEIGVIPELYAPVWNMNHILNEKEGVGSFLKALFGYNGNPSLIEVIAYTVYLISLPLFLRKKATVAAIPSSYSQ